MPTNAPRRQPERRYCPVLGCLHGDPLRARGWTTKQALRNHLNEHSCGRLPGAVPQEVLQQNSWDQCSVCGSLVSTRYNGVCPHCRPAARAAVGEEPGTTRAHDTPRLPSLEAVHSRRVRMLKYVPKEARKLWGQCVARTAALVVLHNDEAAWTEWEMLAKTLLCTPKRQGKAHKTATVAFTKSRCVRWLDGERLELWEDLPATPATKGRKRSKEKEAEARQHLCCMLASDGLYSKLPKHAGL